MKKLLFVIVASFFLVSCRKTCDFSQLQETHTSIVSDLKSKKIVFVGENHNNIYPVLLLAKYIDEFYDTGLRYIFLEGSYPRFQFESDVYKIIPPWINSGWKYEEHILEEKIIGINTLHKNDPIHVIFPEKDFMEDASYSVEGQSELLNKRDFYVQDNIIQILECSKQNEKAIVFYGCNHGKKNIQKFYDFDWKSMGVYLNKYYGEKFTNYRIDTFFDSRYLYGKFGEKECVVVPDSMKVPFYNEELISSFDRLCITKTELYGVPYCYIPTKENICVLIQIAQSQINSRGKNEFQPTVVGNSYMQFLLAIYYLKYYFGDYFSYTLENDFDQLNLALEKISTLINQNQFSFWNDDSKMQKMEEYSKYLYSYGLLEEYLENQNPEYIESIIYNLTQAKKINSHDIWPQYWLSYLYTERALKSQKKKDYKKALANWNELLENTLLLNSPVLKISYEKILICAAALNIEEQYQKYLEKRNRIHLLDFNYKDYGCFGY